MSEISAIEAACERSRGYILALAGRVTEAGWREALSDLDETSADEP